MGMPGSTTSGWVFFSCFWVFFSCFCDCFRFVPFPSRFVLSSKTSRTSRTAFRNSRRNRSGVRPENARFRSFTPHSKTTTSGGGRRTVLPELLPGLPIRPLLEALGLVPELLPLQLLPQPLILPLELLPRVVLPASLMFRTISCRIVRTSAAFLPSAVHSTCRSVR